MRLEFDDSVPLIEKILRVADSKSPGRKHKKTKGVKAAQREKNHLKNSAAFVARKHAKFKSEVSAYWQGLRESYPNGPA